jgi:hypothetical protein
MDNPEGTQLNEAQKNTLKISKAYQNRRPLCYILKSIKYRNLTSTRFGAT